MKNCYTKKRKNDIENTSILFITHTIMADESYFSADEEETDQSFDIYNKIIDRKDNSTFMIKLPFRELIAYTVPWCFNRKIDSNKVLELYDSLCESYTIPYILHAVYDKNINNSVANILILDGQHRTQAAKMYIEKNDMQINCNYFVYICIYQINNSETNNTNTVVDLFRKINNNRVFDETDLPDTFIIDLVKNVCDIPVFKKNKCIKKSDNNNTSHCPFIHKKELNNLFNLNKDIIKAGKKTLTELLTNIQLINHKLSLMKFEDLYCASQRRAETKKYQTAVSLGFFLNLKNSKYTTDVWVKYINEPDKL
jgi:hypothetical protein